MIKGLLEIIANSPEYETLKIQNSNMGVFSVEDALTKVNIKNYFINANFLFFFFFFFFFLFFFFFFFLFFFFFFI